MTTRKIALAVDEDVIPTVASELAARGVVLGETVTHVDGVRCYNATGRFNITCREDLAERDLTILFALADGKTHAQIGALLGIEWATARRRAKSLYRRLGARDKCEAVAIAYRMGALNAWKATA